MQNKKKEELSPVKLKCKQCVYKTKNRSDLRRHERRHKDVKFPCDICNMPFMTAGHLGGHKRSAHNVHSERVTSKPVFRQFCHQCDYTTIYSSDMSKHRRKHDVNQHPCPICNYPFGHITTLRIHIRKYHGEDDTVDFIGGPKRECSVTNEKRKIKEFEAVQTDLKENIPFHRRSGTTNKIPEKREARKVSSTIARKFVERNPEKTIDKYDSDSIIAHKVNVDETLHAREAIYSQYKASPVTEYKSSLLKCENAKTQNLQKHLYPKKIQSSLPNKDMNNRKKTFACKDCAFNTRDEETFERHNKRHDKGKFTCQKCGMPFLFKTNLDKHLETKHADQSESSDSSFDTLTVNSPTVLKCAQCKFVTFSYGQLESHVTQHGSSGRADQQTKLNLQMDSENDVILDKTNAEHDQSVEIDDEVRRYYECKKKGKSVDDVSDVDLDDQAKPPGNREELIKFIEEFHCRECNYVTSDKKFIKLHMTMHGSNYMAPRNGSNRARSISGKALGYEMRLKRTNNAQVINPKDIDLDSQQKSCNTTVDYNRLGDKTLYENLLDDTCPPNNETTNAVNLDKDCERENLNMAKSEISKENGDSISTGTQDTNLLDLIGGLTKEDFKRTKKFYETEQINDKVVYGCKLCVVEGKFKAQNELYYHFNSKHRELRERICASCKYCNGPFPALQ